MLASAADSFVDIASQVSLLLFYKRLVETGHQVQAIPVANARAVSTSARSVPHLIVQACSTLAGL